MVRGTVAHFTYLRLSGLAPFGRNKLINNLSGVTRSHSFPNWEFKTLLKNLAKPYGFWSATVFFPEKELFHLLQKLFHLLQTRAAVGSAQVFSCFLKPVLQKLFHPLLPLFDQNLPQPRRQAMRPSANSRFGAFGFGFAFDLGTSPHGLSADLPLPNQETQEARSLRFPAKPVLTLGGCLHEATGSKS